MNPTSTLIGPTFFALAEAKEPTSCDHKDFISKLPLPTKLKEDI